MASPMVSRWPVVIETTILPGDCDDAGALTPGALARLFDEARAAYFERCTTVDAAAATTELFGAHQNGAFAPCTDVQVATGATELFSARVHMGMRVRGESDCAVDATWSVAVGEVTPVVRDELIGLAHRAAFTL